MRVVVGAVVLALFGTFASAPAASAHPLQHPDVPRVLDLEPAPGAVVSARGVTIRALAASGQPLEAHSVTVDGEVVESSATSGDHAVVTATVALEPGRHTVAVSATTAAGTGQRQWRFTVSPLRVGRLAGPERIATAVRISQELYAEGEGAAAVLARADEFPDALAGVPLAHAVAGPLLLTQPSRLTEATGQELRRVLPAGATVYLLGGEGALAPQVAADVAGLGFAVERLAGENRYETAVEIARLLPEADHAMLASGEDFADALAASSPAAIRGYPVLLTRPGSLPAEVRDYVADQGLRGVHVVGGPAAIGPAVRDEVGGLVDGMSQTAGATRFETAAAVGRRFFPEADVVTLASGAAFPDALAGGVLAAAHAAPMLLAASTRVFNPQLSQIGSLQPERAFVLGGHAAIGTTALYDLLRGVVDRDGPLLTDAGPSGTVSELQQVVLSFDRDVDAAASSVYVTVDGHEVAGSVSAGASARSLRFSVREFPALAPGRAYAGQVVARAVAGETTRHVEHHFTFRARPPQLGPGDAGPEVTALQRRLRDAGYWVGAIDGRYGTLTVQAVMALEKVHGLRRDGVYDEEPRRVLESRPARPRPRTGPGDGLFYEIDLNRQVLMRVVNGQVTWIFNTSTGHGRWYWFQGRQYRANTTTGNHPIRFQRDYPHEAERGLLWRPKYYDTTRGIAIHGSGSVPAYPASAGCVRLTIPAMDFIWSLDPAPTGRVLVYPADYYD